VMRDVPRFHRDPDTVAFPIPRPRPTPNPNPERLREQLAKAIKDEGGVFRTRDDREAASRILARLRDSGVVFESEEDE
jgi:succinate dehydrogenase/fumarate reductase flavoprotein subunit